MRSRPLELAGVAALGAAQTWAYDHGAWWPLPLLTLALLVWRLDAARPARAAVLAWAYGVGWLCAGVWWLYLSMHDYGSIPAPLAALAVFALAAFLSLYLAAAGAAYARWRRGGAMDALLFAALWLLAELARGVIFTGFPWIASGYSQIDSPLALLAPWVGVYGIGALLAGAAVTLRRLDGRAAAVVVAIVGAAALAPRDFTRGTGTISVALLQTDVKQDEKFETEHLPDELAWTGRALTDARADLVVGPETVVPLLPDQLEDFAPGYWAAIRRHFAAPGRAALIGIPLGSDAAGYTNSVLGLSAGPTYRYDKAHLVPFGEFVPTGFHWFTRAMNIPLGDFNRGIANPPSFAFDGQRVAPNICYEDLFGEELARRFVDAARAPTMFANLSNLAWFGNTSVIPQVLNISRMRTLEFERPMLRATNTGATAVIDHRGHVTALLPPYTRGVLAGRVEGRTGTTPYA
ncbi:MAG: apolipoprotein N-acyltransferase, partial [Burkholderiales bacterium]|nr:apolipoprotein N-acyltransferase [Burkholderiales bacterium]